MPTKTITDANFTDDVLQAEGPVLVDFWAEWCPPCKAIGPALEEISEELAGQVTIGKLNIEEQPDTPARFGVRNIPTLIIFKDGQPISTQLGAAPKARLKSWIEGAIDQSRTGAAPSSTRPSS